RTAAHEKKRTSVLSDLAKAGAHDPDLAFQALGLQPRSCSRCTSGVLWNRILPCSWVIFFPHFNAA
ncbi:MAG: hypothetical protein FWF99_05950, partial [Desulfovibrionaceae bacterium]|nr:hypothetical protein [Desulfovibrionaceae bacterium]